MNPEVWSPQKLSGETITPNSAISRRRAIAGHRHAPCQNVQESASFRLRGRRRCTMAAVQLASSDDPAGLVARRVWLAEGPGCPSPLRCPPGPPGRRSSLYDDG